MSKPAHSLTLAEVVNDLKTEEWSGLNDSEAKRRVEEYGPNELEEAESVPPVKILIAQVANAMTLVFILAMAVGFDIKSWIEGGVVAFVVGLNIVVGFFQEWSAEKTMDSLRSLSSPTARLIRGGQQFTIPSAEVVPGDIIEVKFGDIIPADIRVFNAVNFETDEAILAGESLPVCKQEDVTFDEKTGPGDRLNVAYSSSSVTKGRANGVVFATGAFTETGAIATQLRETKSKVRPVKRKENGKTKPHHYLEAYTLTTTDAVGRFLGLNVGTPLQKKLSKLAVLLFFIAVVCAIIVLAANEFSNRQEVIIYAVATGLSMIPASLVVVLTITMAAGTKSMVHRHVIVRNLKSLEALGGVTEICSDKTGTLTQDKMIARGAWIPGVGTYTIEDSTAPQDPTAGRVRFGGDALSKMNLKAGGDACGEPISLEKLEGHNVSGFGEFLMVASLANSAAVKQQDDGAWEAHGDPTEIAIQVFAARFGMKRSHLVKGDSAQWEDLVELPFDSDVKRMSVIMKHSSGNHAFTKGAVERVIKSCTSYLTGGKEKSEPITDAFRGEILSHMQALASLGLRVLALPSKSYPHEVEKGAEVQRATVESDLVFRGLIGLYDPPRPESAVAVRQCHEAGIEVHMLTGDHLETARAIAIEVHILPCADRYKRISADIVLTDVNFASILAAIEESRRIFDNIQKFVLHVLAENVAQAGTLLVGLAFKDRTGLSVFPLAPVHVVWIIMATSGLPDMGLGSERAVPDILQRPPQSLKTGIFTLEFLIDMVVYGLWITLLCLTSVVLVVFGFGDGELGEGYNETYPDQCELVFRARACTFAGIEFWKWCKCVYFRRKAARSGNGKVDKNMEIEDRVFGRYYSRDSSTTAEDMQDKA